MHSSAEMIRRGLGPSRNADRANNLLWEAHIYHPQVRPLHWCPSRAISSMTPLRVGRVAFRWPAWRNSDRVSETRSLLRSAAGKDRHCGYAALTSTRLARASGAIGTVMFSIPF